MVNPYLLPLGLLYTDGRREINGATRFQKLVFLAQREEGLSELFKFEADKYGPFSSDLYAALDELESKNLIDKQKRKTRSGNEMFVYSITSRGQSIIKQRLDKDEEGTKKVLDAAQRIKKQHNNEPLERLLRIVYRRYPKLTTESKLDI